MARPPTISGVPVTRAVNRLLLAGAFVIYASANAPVPVSAELRAQLGLSGSSAAVFMLPFAAGFGAGSFAWLAFGRRRSAKVVLPLSLAVVAAASVALLLARSPGVAVAARVLVGMAAAGFPAVAQAVISHAAAPTERGRRLSAFVVAVVAGSFLGGQAIVGALADLASVEVAIGLVCVVAPALVAVALWRELPASSPAPDPDAHAHTKSTARMVLDLAPVLIVAALSFGGYWLLLSELPVALRTERFHLSAAEAGLVPSLGLMGALTASATGRMSDRVGQRAPMLATLALGIVGLAVTLPTGVPLWLFALGYGAFLAAYWGYLAPASAEVSARSSHQDRQPALLAFYAAMWLGAAVAPVAGSVLADWGDAVIAVLAAWALAAAVAAATFTRTPPSP
jgi:YNFM family putative membrane transporter